MYDTYDRGRRGRKSLRSNETDGAGDDQEDAADEESSSRTSRRGVRRSDAAPSLCPIIRPHHKFIRGQSPQNVVLFFMLMAPNVLRSIYSA